MEERIDIFKSINEKKTEKLNTGIDYIDEYENFMLNFRHKEISGAEVGEMVAKMAGYFTIYNLKTIRALKIYSKVICEIQSQQDIVTGKTISSTKAEILASATPEAHVYEEAKAHTQNLEHMINGLKAVQRGVLQDYGHPI